MYSEDLIAEARKFLFSDSASGYEDSEEGDLIYRLLEALEAVEAERDTAKKLIDRMTASQEFYSLLTKAEAERDDALAAVERVRKYADERSVYAKTRNNTVGSWRIASDLYDILNVSLEEQAALDGAPEPEWEWGYAGETLVGVHNSISREAAEEDVANLRRYWNDERKFWVVRRTPASEWLPVEGESK